MSHFSGPLERLHRQVAPYLPMGPPVRVALRLMAPAYHFDEHFADQFAFGGRYFKAADPRVARSGVLGEIGGGGVRFWWLVSERCRTGKW